MTPDPEEAVEAPAASEPPAEPATEPDAPADPETPPTPPRGFSFACFPAERVAVLACMVAGPGVAVAMLQRIAESARHPEQGWFAAVSSLGASSRLFAGGALLVALAVVTYGALFLQWRAGTRLEIDALGFRFVRRPVLPLGILGSRVEQPWDAVEDARLVTHRGILGRRPELRLSWPAGHLRLPLTDAWEDGAGPRPWLPRRPATASGWADHPLVVAVVGRAGARD